MMMNQLMKLMETLAQELKDAPPDKRDHFLNSTVSLFDVAKEAMEKSPEFRQGFAKVHSEFLKYPECKETIAKSIEAYERFLSK